MDTPEKIPAPKCVDPLQIKQLQELKHSRPLLGGRFDPRGRYVFVSAEDNTIRRWDLVSGQQVALEGHKSWVRGIAFADKLIFTADYTGKVLAWHADADDPKPKFTIDAHKGWARALAVSPDGKTLATCGNDALVKLWNCADGKPIRELAGHTSHVYNVGFHPDGKHLVSGDLKGKVKQWDLATAKEVRELDASVLYKYDETFRADIGGIRSLAFNGDGSLLACAGISEVTNAFAGVGKPLIVLFDWQTGKTKQQLKPKDAFQGVAWGVVFHREGWIAGAGGGNGGALWFWKPDQQLAFHTLKLPNNARDLTLDPSGERLAIPFFDGITRIYDLMGKAPA